MIYNNMDLGDQARRGWDSVAALEQTLLNMGSQPATAHIIPAGAGGQPMGDGGIGRRNEWLALQRNIQNRINTLKENQSANQGMGSLSDLMNSADPFASQRAGYAQQLSALMSDPTSAIENNPFLKASSEQGMEAARRKLNQIGMGVSGNAALELQKASQANLSNDFFKLSDLLGGFAGAKADPSAGAKIGLDYMKLMEDKRQFDLTPRAVSIGGSRRSSEPSSNLNSSGPSFSQRMDAYWAGEEKKDNDYFAQYGRTRPSYM